MHNKKLRSLHDDGTIGKSDMLPEESVIGKRLSINTRNGVVAGFPFSNADAQEIKVIYNGSDEKCIPGDCRMAKAKLSLSLYSGQQILALGEKAVSQHHY